MKKNWTIAVVIPWFGKNLKGGAEQQCWQVVHRLQKEGAHVTVLTSCSESFLKPWDRNFFSAGQYLEQSIEIIRFPVKKRNTRKFNKVVDKLLSIPKNDLKSTQSPISIQEEDIYWSENINSPSLTNYISDHYHDFDYFIFIPYLFSISADGVLAAGDKAILQPCLHDECYAYLNKTKESILSCLAILFNSKGEFELAKNIYGKWIEKKSYIVGEGIEFDHDITESEAIHSIPAKFLLYLGRKSKEKNTDLVVDMFDKYTKLNNKDDISLVLAGPETIPLPKNRKILDFGLVDPQLKSLLLKNCKALINLSTNESFSRVIYESWYHGKPVIINRNCLATYSALEESNHLGWGVHNYMDFEKSLNQLLSQNSEQNETLKTQAHNFAMKASSWSAAIDRYMKVFDQLFNRKMARKIKPVLIIYNNDKFNLEIEEDLKLYLTFLQDQTNIYLLGKHKIKFKNAARFNLVHHNEILKLIEMKNLKILWFGDNNWDDILKTLASLKKSYYHRYENRIDFKKIEPNTMSYKTIDTQYFSSMYCHNFIQRSSYRLKYFNKFNKEDRINILLFIDDHKNLNLFKSILHKFSNVYAKKITIFLPQGLNFNTELNSLWIQCQYYNLDVSTQKIPSYIYDVSEIMVAFNDPTVPMWQVYGCVSHNLPVVLYDCQKLSSLHPFTSLDFETDPGGHKLMSLIKLVSDNPKVRHNMNELNQSILNKSNHNNPQNKIDQILYT